MQRNTRMLNLGIDRKPVHRQHQIPPWLGILVRQGFSVLTLLLSWVVLHHLVRAQTFRDRAAVAQSTLLPALAIMSTI
jgi:hypothetical protein